MPEAAATDVGVSDPGRQAIRKQRGRSEKGQAPPRWTKPLEWWATRLLIRTLVASGAVLPARVQFSIGRSLGRAAYRLMPRYRKVALANLRRVFGSEWSEQRIEQTALASFEHLGITLVEFFLLQGRLTAKDAERLIRFDGEENYAEAARRGHGTLLITAHYGNWELIGPRLACAGYQVHAVSRAADDPGLEQQIEAIRTRCGTRAIPRQRATREGLLALRNNEVLAILLDQNTAEGGVFVPFFGDPASTATGPAVFALKTGAAIVPTFCVRETDGSHRMVACAPILPRSTGNRALDIYHLTAEITRVIEEQIRNRPEQWFWLHNRWKLQPEPGQEWRPAPPDRLGERGTLVCPACE